MFVAPVYAQCPVCIVTVGGGLFIAEKLGINSLLVSIWLSAFNCAVAYFLATKFKKPILKSGYFWSIIFYLLTVFYLDISKQLEGSLIGLSIGLIVAIFSIQLDQIIKNLNKGKVLFYYQKVIIPIIILIIATLITKKFL